jgi:hypothetical protein
LSRPHRRTAGAALTLSLTPLLLTLPGCDAPQAPPAPPAAPASAAAAAPPGAPPSAPATAGFGAAPAGPCPRGGKAVRDSRTLDPTAASYLGRDGDDAANAVDVSPACEVIVGGRFTGRHLAPVTTLDGGGAGAVLRLDATGRRLLGVTRLAGTVDDLEVRRRGGDIAVATDRGLVLLDPRGGKARWRRPGAVSRVAVGAGGTVAAVSGTTVRVYDAAGAPLSTVRLAGRTVNDVAVDDRSGLVFVTGFRQTGGGRCRPVQIAFLHAYDRAGRLRWTGYDHPAPRLGDLCADSRGDRVAVGRDGMLYLAGETAGGTSVFSRNARDLARPAPDVVIDRFTQSFNTGSAHHTYVARFDPATGRHLAGQVVIARIDSKGDKGNTITPRAVTADEKGRVYVAGVSAYQIADRGRLTLNGRRLRPYAGGDAWTLVLSADLRTRVLWTVWTDGGSGEVRGVAAGNGLAATAARVDEPAFHVAAPVQRGDAPAGGAGHVAVWAGQP